MNENENLNSGNVTKGVQKNTSMNLIQNSSMSTGIDEGGSLGRPVSKISWDIILIQGVCTVICGVRHNVGDGDYCQP